MIDIDSFFLNRRTIRRYDADKPVDYNMLADMLDAARMAPNTGNMQLYSVVVTTSPERLAALASEGHFNQPAAAGAKAILTFCVDMRRFARWCETHETESSLNNFQGFIWAVIDAVIFAQQFVTIAEKQGLGTCYLGTTTYNTDAICRLLDLPRGVLPLLSVSVGWPAEEGDPKQRLPKEAVIFHEVYKDPSPEEITSIYSETESSPESLRFVAENSKPSLAHVFTEVRYPKDGTELFSGIFLDRIREMGIKI